MYSILYFLTFFNIVPLQLYALFATLVPSPEGGGERFFGDLADHPVPGRLDAVSGEGEASQLLLHVREQEEVRRRQIRRIGRVGEPLDVVSGEPFRNDSSCVNRGVVSMENEPLLNHLGPFRLHFLHEDLQGLHNVGGVHCGALRDDVGVDQAGGVKECQNHVLGSGGVDACLYRARMTLGDPVFLMLFGLRGVQAHHGFIHRHNVVKPGHRVAVDGGDEILANSHPLFLLLL